MAWKLRVGVIESPFALLEMDIAASIENPNQELPKMSFFDRVFVRMECLCRAHDRRIAISRPKGVTLFEHMHGILDVGLPFVP